ncbi:N-6 DNA methylase, partial [Methylobacterium sp. P5_C11]
MSIEPSLSIDALRSLSSRIRGSDRLTTGRRILVLAALALLAKECRLESLWKEIRSSAVHYGDSAQIEALLFKVAALVEHEFGSLEGIFTHHLVRDILLVGGSLPEHVSSASELTQFPEFKTIEKFGAFFDSALDDLSFGPSISETATPRPLARLMVDLARCFEGAKVADFSCGQGALLAETARRKLGCYLIGQELNSVAASLATLRLFLLGSKAKIVISDALLAPLLTP